MGIIEIIAVVFTLVCVYLLTKRNILNWPIGIIGAILYGFIFFDAKLYADFGLQILFVIQGIFGWISWQQNKDESDKVEVSFLSLKWKLITGSILISSWILISYLLSFYTDASAPWIDTFVVVTSIIANYLLIKRKVDSWYLWILADVIYIGLFIYKDLYPTAILYSILLGLAIKGYHDWYKKIYNNTF